MYHFGEDWSHHRPGSLLMVEVSGEGSSELGRLVGLEAEAQTQLCAGFACYELERMAEEDHLEHIVHILDTEREEEQGEPHCQVRPYPGIESWC